MFYPHPIFIVVELEIALLSIVIFIIYRMYCYSNITYRKLGKKVIAERKLNKVINNNIDFKTIIKKDILKCLDSINNYEKESFQKEILKAIAKKWKTHLGLFIAYILKGVLLLYDKASENKVYYGEFRVAVKRFHRYSFDGYDNSDYKIVDVMTFAPFHNVLKYLYDSIFNKNPVDYFLSRMIKEINVLIQNDQLTNEIDGCFFQNEEIIIIESIAGLQDFIRLIQFCVNEKIEYFHYDIRNLVNLDKENNDYDEELDADITFYVNDVEDRKAVKKLIEFISNIYINFREEWSKV